MNIFETHRRGIVALAATLGVAVVGVSLTGCGRSASNNETAANDEKPAVIIVSPPPSRAIATNDTNAGPGGPHGTQTATADAVSRRIIRNTQMTGSRVDVIVNDAGAATLTGFVQNQQQKALAEKAARDTSGVNDVIDKLEIRPTGGTGKMKPTPAAPAATPAPPTTTTNVIIVPGAAGNNNCSASGSGNTMYATPPAPPAPPMSGSGSTDNGAGSSSSSDTAPVHSGG